MKRWFTSLLILFSCSLYAFNNQTRVALYYGDNPPLDELHAFNVVVVNPRPTLSPKTYNNPASQLFAYISVGEVDRQANYSNQIASVWRKGFNPDWNSDVMDLDNPAWRDYLLNQLIEPLWQDGYRGFFLDTLDSYRLLTQSQEEMKKQQAGLVTFIKSIKAKHPDVQIIANRGFEILKDIHQDIDAVAAESLFASWRASTKTYVPVSENDRKYLINALNTVKTEYKLPVIVIDYLPPNQRQQARDVAKNILALGFMPWVSDPSLETLGIGSIEVIPRRIVLLYNAKSLKKDMVYSIAYDATAFFLQFLGYIPIQHVVDGSLPMHNLNDRYAGVLTWFNMPIVENHQLLEKWLSRVLQQKVPLVFMDYFGIPAESPLFKTMGIERSTPPSKISSVNIVNKDPMVGYEVFPKPSAIDFFPLRISTGQSLLTIAAGQQRQDLVALMPWGGYALQGYSMVNLSSGQARWVINPMEFLKKALQLPVMPIPDVTTENGNRILTIHIDGDAFISRVPWKKDQFAAEVLLEEIFKIYRLPTTVSIIQREFELIAINSKLLDRLSQVARETFKLPWVQIATHTYSHPLEWRTLVEGQLNSNILSYPSASYLFNYETEIVGSTNYINDNLAPPNKKVGAVFWSGNADPLEKPLKITYEAGLKNINGMSEVFTNIADSVSNMGPMGMFVGNYYQIFAPIANEFEYTNEWNKPFYTFEKVIHTFELTEKPYRFKPMSIYYHFYIGVEQSSLRSLKRIYNWVLKQQSTPLNITDYIDKVMDFNRVVIAKNTLNPQEWIITNNGTLKEFRWPTVEGYPNLETSHNVMGFNTANGEDYIHLGNAVETRLNFTKELPLKPYLIAANAMISADQLQFMPTPNSVATENSSVFDLLMGHLVYPNKNVQVFQFALQGYVPLQFSLANMHGCKLMHNNEYIKPYIDYKYYLPGAYRGAFAIRCEA